MLFHYVAFDAAGKIIEGNTDASKESEVLKSLAAQGLRPISVRAAGEAKVSRLAGFLGQSITITDKVFLTRYLALMLKVGTDLFKAIDILIADMEKPILKNFLLEMRSLLERGQPLHQSFARYPKFFSPVFVNLIKAGESSGNLDKVFGDLSLALEREAELKGRIRGALVYPTLLLVMAIVILTFLVTFALPRIAEVFSGGGFNPPLFSRVVFGVGLFLGKYIWLVLGIGAFILISLGYFLFKTQKGRRFLNRLLNTLPGVKNLVKKIALERFAGTFASLLKSGLPIIESLEITADAVGQEEIAVALRRIAREGIAKGLTVGDAFKKESTFPNVVTNLIAVSEKGGLLTEILTTLGNFYEVEIDKGLKTLVSFLEPALMLVIGVVVAMIALAIIIPIYQLVGQF